MTYKDREKQLEYNKNYNKKHYKENKKYYKDKAKRWKLKLREWYIELKQSKKCYKCDESDFRCIDFHHRDPKTKKHEISYMIQCGMNKLLILKEIEKCDPMCKNCHAKITFYQEISALVV